MGKRSAAMDRSTIYIIDEDGRRKDRTAQFLAGLAFDVKTLASPSELISRGCAVEEPGVAVVSLLDLTADRTGLLRQVKKALPEMSLIGLFRPEDYDAGITLLRNGLVNQIAVRDT